MAGFEFAPMTARSPVGFPVLERASETLTPHRNLQHLLDTWRITTLLSQVVSTLIGVLGHDLHRPTQETQRRNYNAEALNPKS